MIINEESYTYKDMIDKLTDGEVKLMMKLFEYMTEDNLLYLYQRVSKRDSRQVIVKIADELKITKKTVQNTLSNIISKQDTVRYFLYATESPIKGEYLVSPELALKCIGTYNDIYKSIITKIEENRQ